MWRYIKSAFWASPELPGLGRFPVNVAGVTGMLILGFAQPAFWLLGMGLETAYIVAMVTNRRFQKLVEAEQIAEADSADDARHRALIQSLPAPQRERLQRLQRKCDQIMTVYRDGGAEEPLVAANWEALRRFVWMFLKLLVAERHLASADQQTDADSLAMNARKLEGELGSGRLSPSLRTSKEATLRILRQRLENVSRRNDALAEIESDLKRIEEQVELALEEAGMQGKPAVISGHIDLVSRLLEDSFGSASADVAALDRAYAPPEPARAREEPTH